MSYDVSIGKFSSNYTWNGNEMWFQHMEFKSGEILGMNGLHGLTGKQGAKVMSKFIKNIQNEKRRIENKGMREKYDSPNGWGSTEGLLIFALELTNAFYKSPKKKIHIG